MKKIFYTVLLLFGGYFCAIAQSSSSRQIPPSEKDKVLTAKMAEIKDCPELDKQLTALFGKDYSISDSKVLAQLKKNIADKNASSCIRKKSLYGIYGEEYINKSYLINPKTN